MPPVALATLRSHIAAGAVGTLYLLVGEDEAEKSAVAADFMSLVERGLEAFNVDRLYGGETKVDALIAAARTLPMMAPRRLVIVLEAEKLLFPKRETKASEEDQERLEAFVQDPPGHATIVFVCGAVDLRRRVAKMLVKDAGVVNCGTIETPEEAERWIAARAQREQIPLGPGAARALAARAGTDIVRLRAGLERLALFAMGRPSITVEDVREAVAAGPQDQTEFGIANAIGRNDVRGALRELTLALDEGAAPYFLLGQIRFAAEKLPPSRVPAGVDAVFRTDLALKTSAGDPRVLLERLVVELCPAPSGTRGPARPASRGGRLS
jgi:DNA polymerase-3 subunit delta